MNANKENKELNALIRLMDEPDKDIFKKVRQKIYSFGINAVPLLEDAWENSFDDRVQQRIEDIIHEIQLKDLYAALHSWAYFNDNDLLKGFILLTKYQYPDLDETYVIRKIGSISQDIWLELNSRLTALEKIKVINHILFDVYEFTGNKLDINAPEHYYLNNMLDTGKGNPLSIGSLYIIVAQSLKIPVFGIDLPGHFILAYVDELMDKGQQVTHTDQVLFYINPFNKGALFTRNEIELYLKQLSLSNDKKNYLPCDNVSIIARMLDELILTHGKAGNSKKVTELKLLKRALR